TECGDRAELSDLPEDLPFWHEVSAAAETCLGSECPRYDECFVTRMRQRAAASDVVIVNHHLLCADASVRQNAYGEVIPSCSHAVLDEAHQLEDIATQYFGYGVSTYRVEDLAHDVERLAASACVPDAADRAQIMTAIDHLRDRARAFFTELALSHRNAGRGRSEERVRTSPSALAAGADAAMPVIVTLDGLQATLALLDGKPAEPGAADTDINLAALARRTGELRDDLRFLLRASDPDYVYFVEFRGRGVFLRATPIDVSSIVRELVLDRMRTTVLTSATLAVDCTFEYIRRRLGVSAAAEVRLASEFDFEQQAILYLPP